MEVTNKNAIVFATRDAVTLTTVHVYDFDSNSVTSVNIGAEAFGDSIGVNLAKNRDFIERLGTNELVVGSLFLWRKNLWYLDLVKKKVIRNEYFDYDPNGVVTNQGVLLPDAPNH